MEEKMKVKEIVQMVAVVPALQEEDLESAACWVQCDCNAKG